MIVLSTMGAFKIKAWLAASKGGQLKIFDTKPERNDAFKIWVGNMTTSMMMFLLEMEGRGLELPRMTYDDEPKEISVELRFDD